MTDIVNKKAVAKLIMESLTSTFQKEITDTGYRNGVGTIIQEVITDNRDKIYNVYNKLLLNVLNGEDFEEQITIEFKRKVAKNMVSKLEGQVEQAVSVIRQDQRLRAKMIVAIENIINKHTDNIPNTPF